MIRRPKTTASSGASRPPSRPTRPGRNNRRSRGRGTMSHQGHFEMERHVQTPDDTWASPAAGAAQRILNASRIVLWISPRSGRDASRSDDLLPVDVRPAARINCWSPWEPLAGAAIRNSSLVSGRC